MFLAMWLKKIYLRMGHAGSLLPLQYLAKRFGMVLIDKHEYEQVKPFLEVAKQQKTA